MISLFLCKDCFSLDILLVQKIPKYHFLKIILNTCQWVIQTGLEPHQFFFLKKNNGLKLTAPFKFKMALVGNFFANRSTIFCLKLNSIYRVLHIFSSPLKSICVLTEQSYSHFQTLSQFRCFRALKRGI